MIVRRHSNLPRPSAQVAVKSTSGTMTRNTARALRPSGAPRLTGWSRVHAEMWQSVRTLRRGARSAAADEISVPFVAPSLVVSGMKNSSSSSSSGSPASPTSTTRPAWFTAVKMRPTTASGARSLTFLSSAPTTSASLHSFTPTSACDSSRPYPPSATRCWRNRTYLGGSPTPGTSPGESLIVPPHHSRCGK